MQQQQEITFSTKQGTPAACQIASDSLKNALIIEKAANPILSPAQECVKNAGSGGSGVQSAIHKCFRQIYYA